MDPEQPISDVRTQARVYADGLSSISAVASMLGAFGLGRLLASALPEANAGDPLVYSRRPTACSSGATSRNAPGEPCRLATSTRLCAASMPRTTLARNKGAPTAERGGRAKRYYYLQPDGARALERSRALFMTVLADLPESLV